MEQKMSNIDNSGFSVYCVVPQPDVSTLAPLFIAMAGDEQCAPTYRLYRENAEVSVLIFVLSGSGRLEQNGVQSLLTAGDVLTLAQGETYGYAAQRADPWRILWFNMAGELYPHWLQQYRLLGTAVHKAVGKQLEAQFWRGLDLCRIEMSAQALQDALCQTMYGIVLALWRNSSCLMAQDGLAPALCRWMDKKLAENCAYVFSPVEAAAQFNVSARQLERLYKKAYGVTPYRHFLSKKILLAKQYLRNTTLSVKEISAITGFCDPYYFSNCFKQQEGVSPKAYRLLG